MKGWFWEADGGEGEGRDRVELGTAVDKIAREGEGATQSGFKASKDLVSSTGVTCSRKAAASGESYGIY